MSRSVPGAGLEPARPFGQRLLRPPRLPFRHPGENARSYKLRSTVAGWERTPWHVKLAGVELVQVDLPFRQAIGTAARRAPGAPAALRPGRGRGGRGLGRVRRPGRGHRGRPRPRGGGAGRRGAGRAAASRGAPRPGAAAAHGRRGGAALRELAGRPHAGRHLRDGRGRRRAACDRAAPWPTTLGVDEGFEAMAGRRGRRASPTTTTSARCAARSTRVVAGRRGPGAAQDRARLGARAGAGRAGRPPRPRAAGRRQRVLQRRRRGRGAC